MSARPIKAPYRHADLPYGQVTQFARQLEAAGFTPELLLYMLENNDSLRTWVQSAKDIYDGDFETYYISKDRPTFLISGQEVRLVDVISPNNVCVDVTGSNDTVNLYSGNTWWCDYSQGIQIQLLGEPANEVCMIAVRYRFAPQFK